MLGKIRAFIASIPNQRIAQIGKFLGLMIYMLDVRHRRIVRRNLKFTYPEWSWEHIHGMARRVFENFGITVVEICQTTCFSKEDVLNKVQIKGAENIKYIKNGNGVILITAHLGNWEMAHLFASCFLPNNPPVAVARPISFKPLDRWVHRKRTRFGGMIIKKKGAVSEMTQVLRRGKVLELLIDQGTKAGEGVEVKFFDRTVQATSAVAMLAMRCKSTVIPAFCVREAGGFTILVYPPLTLQRTKNLRTDIIANTQIMLDAIEKAIRSYPDQWFWFHKRWKVHYPHLYKEDLERKSRQRAKQKRKALLKSS